MIWSSFPHLSFDFSCSTLEIDTLGFQIFFLAAAGEGRLALQYEKEHQGLQEKSLNEVLQEHRGHYVEEKYVRCCSLDEELKWKKFVTP